ncbi:hypothetical protein K501DRAFT_265682 [Backusella circina FSU 941]|nr:hypothetical protein K501DRAFT_265682 [Backusella circina FSU 941]
MTSPFSSFTLKRNRSASSNKGLNALLSKLTNTFHHHKKRRHKKSNNERRSSFSILIDYFRPVNHSSSNASQLQNHPFANDSIFEYRRYAKNQNNNNNNNTTDHGEQQQQKQKNKHDSKIIFADDNGSIYSTKNTPTLLLNNNKLQKNHRHTNSTISQRHTNSSKKSRHIRHYSHVSCISTSNITVNSENLTAKEFADIAGIRILSDDENYATAHSQLGGDSKRCAICDDDDNVINNQSSMVVISRVPSTHVADISPSSSSSSISSPPPLDAEEEEPQIWDTDFWCPPGSTEKSSDATVSIQTKPPILGEIKSNTTDTIIKKGRFEIHLAPNDTCTTRSSHSKRSQPDVVEWKRKKKLPS